MSNKITFYHTFNIITTVIHTIVIFRLNQTNLHWKIPIIYLLWSQIEVPRKVGSISSGFELAICESCFSLIGFVFSRITLGNFLWNPQIRTFLLLELLSSAKPQSFCLHFKLPTICLYLTPKSVKLYTIFLLLDSILVPNPQ